MRYRTVLIFLLLFIILPSGCKKKGRVFSIGILQWTEKIEPFNDTSRGFVHALSESGYTEGLNIRLLYHNVEQDTIEAQRILRQFVNEGMDVIVALGTGSAIAAFRTADKTEIPVVYSIVADIGALTSSENYLPVKQWVTGVTMKVSMQKQFQMAKDILPRMERIGILYCNQMPEAVSTAQRAFETATEMGLNPVSKAIDASDLNHLDTITRQLLAEVDVLYIPADPVLSMPDLFSVIVETADRVKKPVISVSCFSVSNGALFAMHSDFYHLGRQTAYPVARILNGVSPGLLPLQHPEIIRTSLNLGKANLLGIDIPRNVVSVIDNVIQ